MGTVSQDNPTLTARGIDPIHRVAIRVVMCRRHVPSTDSNLVRSVDRAPLLIAAGSRIDEKMLEPLRQRGANIWRHPGDDPTEMVDGLLQHLCGLGATNVMLEGGGAVLASFAEADQIDEFQVYLGPTVLGGIDAPGPIAGTGVRNLADSVRLRLDRMERFENDVKLTYSRETA
jgi:diaminohydroxyphosphoribosylaminopyrimidine deaminase/5-amino-6-(5-phosphoribosylamino)uracil reductase